MRRKRCIGLAVIGYIFFLCSIICLVLLLILPLNSSDSLFWFNIPVIPLKIQALIFSIISLVISYGYLDLKKWSYWAAIIYFVASAALISYPIWLCIINGMVTAFVVVYTIVKRNYFLHKELYK